MTGTNEDAGEKLSYLSATAYLLVPPYWLVLDLARASRHVLAPN
jgi:hypothetical protein